MKHIEKRLKEAYNNVEFFADDTWVENFSYDYCKANQVLWTRECKVRNSDWNKFDPSRALQHCIPESKLLQYSTYEYNDSRESSYTPYIVGETAFHRFDWGYLEPWMFPEVETAFKRLIDPIGAPSVPQIEFNPNENQVTRIKDAYQDLSCSPAISKFLEKTPGCQRYYTLAEPVAEEELQQLPKKKIDTDNFAEMLLLMKTTSDKIKRIWDASSRCRKSSSVSSKRLFNKFYVCDSRKCNKRPRKKENDEHLDESELYLLENHKERVLDFKDIQKLTSSLNALQGWLTAMSRPPPHKEPSETPVNFVLEIPKQTVTNRRSYSAVVQGLESSDTINSEKSLESLFQRKRESPTSQKIAYSSSESGASTKTEYSATLSPRLSGYSPRKRLVPYEQRCPLIPMLGTRWGKMQSWTTQFSNCSSPTPGHSSNNSSTASLDLDTLPVGKDNPILQELYAAQQVESANPKAVSNKKTSSQPNIPHDVQQPQPQTQQQQKIQQPQQQKLQRPPHQELQQIQQQQQHQAPQKSQSSSAASINAQHSFHHHVQHAATVYHQQIPVYQNVSWLPLARNTLYTAATTVQQTPLCQPPTAAYYRSTTNQFHGYQIQPPLAAPQQQAVAASAAAAFHWSFQRAATQFKQQKEAAARLLENTTGYRILQQHQQQAKRKASAVVMCPKDTGAPWATVNALQQRPPTSARRILSREPHMDVFQHPLRPPRALPAYEVASTTDLERQAMEQYSSSHESIFGQLEKQGAEQYDASDSEGNSENWRSPPIPANLFGGHHDPLLSLFRTENHAAVVCCVPAVFVVVAVWYLRALNCFLNIGTSNNVGLVLLMMPRRACDG